jgi:hypothetical protein
MSAIDRIALVLKPKQPYVDWVRSLPGMDPALSAEAAKCEPMVQLLPYSQDLKEVDSFVRQGWELFFLQSCAGWVKEESDLPLGRSFEKFEQWFDWSLAPLVLDLAPYFAAMAGEMEGKGPEAAEPPASSSGIQIVSR